MSNLWGWLNSLGIQKLRKVHFATQTYAERLVRLIFYY